MTDLSPLAIGDIISLFCMERHPTAGWYALHYSDSEMIGRPQLSAIYHLIAGDEPLPAHKSDATEVWSHYLGAPALFSVTDGSRMEIASTLGRDLAGGERPQIAIPAYLWRSCRSLGDWTLLGCTAAPGFSPRAAAILALDD